MIDRPDPLLAAAAADSSTSDWHALAGRVLAGHRLSFDEALAILRSPDEICSICWRPPSASGARSSARRCSSIF